MPRSRRLGRSRFTLILLVLASLTILTLDYRDTGPVQGLRGVAATVFSPFRGIGDAIASPFRNGWNGIFGYDELEDENERLRRRVDELRGGRLEDEAAADDNAELRQLADLRVNEDIPRVTAEVTSAPLTDFDATLEISKGAGDGIKKGMAVVTEAGLVGQVLRVTGGRSRVQLIVDPDFQGFGVKLVELGDRGRAQPTGTRSTLTVRNGIDADTPVTRGAAVVTSGVERSDYPGGIPVGRVLEVGETEDRTEQTLEIEPSADLDGLSYVVVLLCDEDCG